MNIEALKNDDNNLTIIVFGSKLYGSDTVESDTDLIIIQKILNRYDDVNIHCFTPESFYTQVQQGDIACIEALLAIVYKFECVLKYNSVYMVPKLYDYINYIGSAYERKLSDIIDKEQFRKNTSMTCSNSWVKGKKKLIVVADYDLNTAIKSVYHSIRIQDLTIQILENNFIGFDTSNYILADLKKMSKMYDGLILWEKIVDKYRPIYNARASRIRQLVPMEKTSEKEAELKRILFRYSSYSKELYDDLKTLL